MATKTEMTREKLFNQAGADYENKASQCLRDDMRAENTNRGSRGDGEQSSETQIRAMYAADCLNDLAEEHGIELTDDDHAEFLKSLGL